MTRALFISGCVGCVLAGATLAHAGLAEIIETIQTSQFRFARTSSQVPFPPIAWLQARHSAATDFTHGDAAKATGRFTVDSFSQGLFLPIHAGSRDLVFAGESFYVDEVNVESGSFPDQSIATVVPVAGWLRQVNRDNLVATFAAPMFSRDISQAAEWGTQAYAGVVAMRWASDEFQWTYGGVYEYSFGRHSFYPYLGLLWEPTSEWVLALVFPWPTLSYAPRDRWLLSLGITPGGSTWIAQPDRPEAIYSANSWNLTASVGWRMYRGLWLQAGVGITGLRSFKITAQQGDASIETHSAPQFTLSLQLRP